MRCLNQVEVEAEIRSGVEGTPGGPQRSTSTRHAVLNSTSAHDTTYKAETLTALPDQMDIAINMLPMLV